MKNLLNNLPLNGNKTYISGIGMILVGLVGLVFHFAVPDSPYAMDVDSAITLILGGLATIGIGHKIDKTSTP